MGVPRKASGYVYNADVVPRQNTDTVLPSIKRHVTSILRTEHTHGSTMAAARPELSITHGTHSQVVADIRWDGGQSVAQSAFAEQNRIILDHIASGTERTTSTTTATTAQLCVRIPYTRNVAVCNYVISFVCSQKSRKWKRTNEQTN